MMQRVSMWRWLTAAIFAFCSVTAYAQSWPSRPVRMIVPFPPGGTNDIVARSLAPRCRRWQKRWSSKTAGSGGNVGAEAVAKVPNDGYTC